MTDENVVSGEEVDAIVDPVDGSSVEAESEVQSDVGVEASAVDGGAPSEAVEDVAVEDVAVENVAVEGASDEPESVEEEEELPPESDEPVNEFGFTAAEMVGDDDDEDDDGEEDVSPIEEFVDEAEVVGEDVEMNWYILKVQVNRERSICEALQRRVKQGGLDGYFGDILVPTEDVREFNKSGKQRVVKRKLYPGYVVVRMAINDDTWFLVRETPGIGDFTGAVGKPAPLSQAEIDRIIATSRPVEDDEGEDTTIKTAIKFKVGDRVRVKEGYFQNHEGDISKVDERNGRIEVMINIFGRPNPVELDHWQVEDV